MSPAGKPEHQYDWLQRNLFWVVRTSWLTYALLALSGVAVVFTYLVLTGSTTIEPTQDVRVYLTLLLAILFFALAALVVGRLVQLWQARRSGYAAARLHGRLVTIFSLIAVVPVIMTAGAAAITINLAMEAWFSSGVRSVVDNSLAVTNAYVDEYNGKLRNEVLYGAANLNVLTPIDVVTGQFSKDVEALSTRLGADVKVYEVSGSSFQPTITELTSASGALGSGGVDPPSIDEISRARTDIYIDTDVEKAKVRGIAQLDLSLGPDKQLFLVISRGVNPQILEYQRNTEQVVTNYKRLEQERDDVQLTFIMMYGIVACVLLLIAIWIGLGTANRIVMPIGRLINASERVSEGDLKADDEVASLSRAFNRMTSQLSAQRSELMEAYRQIDERRRFTETVLSGVTAGVIGLDAEGRVNLPNRSASGRLGVDLDAASAAVVPPFPFVADTAPPSEGDRGPEESRDKAWPTSRKSSTASPT